MRKVSLNYGRCDCGADRDGIEDHDRRDCPKSGASERGKQLLRAAKYGTLIVRMRKTIKALPQNKSTVISNNDQSTVINWPYIKDRSSFGHVAIRASIK